MKEKNKSILKKLGVGALACLGVFTFAGCSSVEISKDQLDTVMETVEQSNKYMQDQIDLLKNQNEQLQNQNNILTEQNQILEDANNKLTNDEIFTKVLFATNKLKLNLNNVLDNLKVTATFDGDQTALEYFYKTTDGTRVKYYYEKEGEGFNEETIYSINNGTVVYSSTESNSSKHRYNGTSFETIILRDGGLSYLDELHLMDGKNVVKCEITSQGNCDIALIGYKEETVEVGENKNITIETTIYYNVVLDKNGNILEINTTEFSSDNYDSSFDTGADENWFNIKFEYGVIKDADITQALHKAQGAPETT